MNEGIIVNDHHHLFYLGRCWHCGLTLREIKSAQREASNKRRRLLRAKQRLTTEGRK